jgi:hypothetical protein
MKPTSLAFVILALVLAATAQTTDLSGNWKITWLSGGKPNNVTLTDDAKRGLTGDYTADNGEDCPVSGFKSRKGGGKVYLRVACQKWDIDLEGVIADSLTITGDYKAFGTSTGKFKMEHSVCMLPEGCK